VTNVYSNVSSRNGFSNLTRFVEGGSDIKPYKPKMKGAETLLQETSTLTDAIVAPQEVVRLCCRRPQMTPASPYSCLRTHK